MFPTLIALLVSSPLAADAGKKLLILEFKHEAADAESARLLNDVAATASSEAGVEVITSNDIKQAIELEANKAALGCDTDSSSCLAEIAGAMGADLVMFGSIGKIGDVFLVTLNLFDEARAKSVGRKTVRVREETELIASVEQAVRSLLGKEDSAASDPPLPIVPIALASVAGAGVLVAAIGVGVAAAENGAIEPAQSGLVKQGHIDTGRTALVVGVVGVVIAASAGTAAALLWTE